MSKLAVLEIERCEESADQRVEWLPVKLPPTKYSLSFSSVQPLLPRRGILCSLILHLCVIAAAGLRWWPGQAENVMPHAAQEWMEITNYQTLTLPLLPSMASSRSGAR